MTVLKRRLAALWFADIVGYSELSHRDESKALEIIQLFQVLTRSIVGRHSGNLVKFLGDGALAEFPSTEAAVRAACMLRTVFTDQTKVKNLGDRRLHIGVHVGEIATSPDGDVYGDGVNATARIMNLAEPGQVLVSQDVWHQLRQRKEFEFGELDKHDLRGAGRHAVCTVDVSEGDTAVEWTESEAAASHVPTSLFSELRRRHVFRVAVAYAVAAWLVTQIAAIVVPALFLPAWMTRTVIVLAMLGFPIALVLAWAFEMTPEGVRRTPSIESKAAQPLGSTWLRSRKLLAAAVVVGVLAISWATWKRGPLSPPPLSASSVAILPFNVRGSEQIDYLGKGMVNLLSTKLDGVDQFRSVDPQAILRSVQRIGPADIDSETAEMVAERFGAGFYVVGNVVELGSDLYLDASMYTTGDGSDPIAQVSVQGNPRELMGLVDQLVGMLLTANFAASETDFASLAAMTTDSLSALKAYLEGEREYDAGRFTRAVEAFQRAVAIDSLFALAHYRLGMSATWIPDHGLVATAAENALKNSTRLSPPDRVLVQAFHAQENAQPETAKELLRDYLELHQDSAEAWSMYGDVLFHYSGLSGRPMSEAREPFEKALELHPTNNTLLTHLLEIAASENNFVEFNSLLQRIESGSEFELQWRALRDFAIGGSIDQEQTLAELASATDDQLALAVEKVAMYSPGGRGAETVAQLLLDPQRPSLYNKIGHLWQMTLNLRGGRWEATKDELTALEPFDANRALRLHAFYATMPFLEVPIDELRTLMRRILEWDPAAEATDTPSFDPLYRHHLIGLLAIKLGDTGAARTAIQTLGDWQGTPEESNVGGFLAHHLEAHLARQDGRSADALRALSEPTVNLPMLPVGELYQSPFIWHAYERFTRAELLFEAGRFEEALNWYKSLMGGSWLNLPFSAMSHLRLGEIYEELGEPQLAKVHYRSFVETWSECDPALRPILEEAEQRLARLEPVS